MKKIYFLLIASILLGVSCNTISAQAPYKASVGGVLPSFFAVGPSAKFFFSDHLAFQADIMLKNGFTIGKDIDSNQRGLVLYVGLETNLNFVYQKKLKEKKKTELFWFTGSGISFGYTLAGNGKFGANAIVGMEYVFKNSPISIQVDFRPGYGMLFSFDRSPVSGFFFTHKSPWSHFDWLIGFTLRYTFKKKIDN